MGAEEGLLLQTSGGMLSNGGNPRGWQNAPAPRASSSSGDGKPEEKGLEKLDVACFLIEDVVVEESIIRWENVGEFSFCDWCVDEKC